jgi:electron transport complex protein RnfC
VGCVVQNVGTLKAMAEAFSEGKPLIERGLTVTGGACKQPKDIIVPIGTIIADIPDSDVAVDEESVRKVIFGGPMMGVTLPHRNIPVQKNTSGVVLMTAEEVALDTDVEGACIRCGRCLRSCACRLSPVIMNNALDAGEFEQAADIGLLDCIECGACTFVCPARIQLVQRFRIGKQLLRAKRASQAKPPAPQKA